MSTSLQNKAIAHITDQMMASQNDPSIVAIEELLTSMCTTDRVAQALLTPEKTLKGAYEAMRKTAEKNQVNRCGCIPPDEAIRIISSYYGIDASAASEPSKASAAVIDISDLL